MWWFALTVPALAGWDVLELTRATPSVQSPTLSDLDGDGDDDLLVVVSGPTPLLWADNVGGALAVPVPVTRDGRAATHVRAADLDGDGAPDVLAAGPDGTAWYRTLSGGLWGPAQVLDAEISRAVHAADVDGDGDLDVIVTRVVDDSWGWVENLGGTFGALQVVDTVDSPEDVVAADLNGDGLDDVVVAGRIDGLLRRYDSTGSGFAPGVVVGTGSVPAQLHLADVDGSGTLDLLLADGDGLSWYAEAVPGPPQWLTAAAQAGKAVTTGDVDGDGVVDVVGAVFDWVYYSPGYGYDTPPLIYVYPGLGGGSFGLGVVAVSPEDQRDLTLGDLDGDGLPELVAARSYDGVLAVHRNQGGTFGGPNVVGTACNDPEQLICADLDADGDDDVVAVCGWAGVVSYEHLGDRFGPQQVLIELDVPTDVGAGDFDGDGDLDLAVCERTEVHVLDQTPGGFVTTTVTAGGAFPGNCSALMVADLDLDGDPDVITTDLGDLRVWENAAGLVQPGLSAAEDVGFIDSFGVGDLDGDGLPDVVTADYGEVFLHRGDGALGFATERVDELPASAGELVVADVDNDGLLDIVAATWQDTWWLRGLGGGAFDAPALVGASPDAESLVVMDSDGDGDLDVVVGTQSERRVLRYLNLGTGFGAAEELYDDVSWPSDLLAVDGDGDGDLDVIVASLTSDTVIALLEPRLEPVDADGDGFSVVSDCDDTNPEAHPGATERCGNGVDEDCDGSDEPCVDTGDTGPGDTGRPGTTGGTGVSADTGAPQVTADTGSIDDTAGEDTGTRTNMGDTGLLAYDGDGVAPLPGGCGCGTDGTALGWAPWMWLARR